MFTRSEDKHGLRQTQFVLCGELLATDSLKSSKFNSLLETKFSVFSYVNMLICHVNVFWGFFWRGVRRGFIVILLNDKNFIKDIFI